MALATTCPQCKTSFKVVPDQLKLRRGLVRCGVCQHVFSGIDFLRYVDDASRAAARTTRPGDGAGPVPQGLAAGTPRPDAAGGSPAAAPRDAGMPPAGAPGALVSGPSSGAPSAPAADPWLAAAAAAHERSLRDEPAADGPGTIVEGDLKTAFFLPDTSFGTGLADPPPPPRVPIYRSGVDPSASGAAARGEADAVADRRDATAPPAVDASPTADDAARRGTAVDGTAGDGRPTDATAGDVAAGDDGARPAHGARPADASAPGLAGLRTDAERRGDEPAPDGARDPAALPTEARDADPRAPADGAIRPGTSTAPAAATQLPGATEPAGAAEPARAADPVFPTDPWRTPDPAAPALATGPVRAPDPAHATEPADAPQGRFAGTSPASAPPPDDDVPHASPLRPSAGEAAAFVPVDPDPADRTFVPVDPDPADRARTPATTDAADPSPADGGWLRPETPADDAPQAAPWRRPSTDAAAPAPPGVRFDVRDVPLAPPLAVPERARDGGLGRSPLAWAAAAVLAIALALQALVGWRDSIAARVPALAPALAAAVAPFGLSIGPPRELSALTIEGFELRPGGGPELLLLSAVLRNGAGHAVGYPAMELTLTDSAGALLVRKVIPPQDYLDGAALDAGLAARSERPLRVTLSHDGLQPTGYAVALFYP